MRQHARHRIVNGTAKSAALRGDVNERNRPLFDPRVLIHVRP
jgi:hypothetical protein